MRDALEINKAWKSLAFAGRKKKDSLENIITDSKPQKKTRRNKTWRNKEKLYGGNFSILMAWISRHFESVRRCFLQNV
jgi:hypothetical protein